MTWKKALCAGLLGAVLLVASEVDDFNRTDDLGSCGANWTAQEGVWGIQSNTCTWQSGVSAHIFRSNVAFANDQFSEGTVKNTIGAADFAEITARASGTGGSMNYYSCMYDDNEWRIRKVVAGTPTDITTGGTGIAANDVLRIEVSGTTITCKKNGSTVDSTTDSDLASGSPGLGTPFNATNPTSFDDWSGGDLGGAASFIPAIINAPVRGGGFLRFLMGALR